MLNKGMADITIANSQHRAINMRVKSICKRRTLNGNMIANNRSNVITIKYYYIILLIRILHNYIKKKTKIQFSFNAEIFSPSHDN